MRSLLAMVADKDARMGIGALLTNGSRYRHPRPSRHLAAFDFQVESDLRSVSGHDGHLHVHVADLLAQYRSTHQRVLVFLDQQFGGELPAAEIHADICKRLTADGWSRDRFEAIVFDPEIEIWMWQDRDNATFDSLIGFGQRPTDALRYHSVRDWLRHQPAASPLWPDGQPKPPDPKQALEWTMRRCQTPLSSTTFANAAEILGDKGCTDASYQSFNATMVRWFGPSSGWVAP